MTWDTVVIGGGFAGLSAATALAEVGMRVMLVEARPSLGGRASAFVDPATGERVDNGQHVLFGCYDETFRFLRRIGTDTDVELQRTLSVDIIDRAGAASRLTCPNLPAPIHLLAGVMRWRALSVADRAAVLGMAVPLLRLYASRVRRRGDPADLQTQGPHLATPFHAGPGQTVRQWLVRHGQTPRLIDLLWEPLAVAALNQSIDVAAAGPFAQVLAGLFSSNARAASLGLPRKPLDELYALPARSYMESRGGRVICGEKARVLIRRGTGNALGVSVGDEVIDAASVIVAVPWHGLDDVLAVARPALRDVLDRAAAVEASSIVTVNLWLDRALPTGPFVGLPGRTFQWVFDKGAIFGAGSSHVSMVASGADGLVSKSNDEVTRLAWGELVGAMPSLAGASMRRSIVVRERRATFSVAPGSPTRPSTRTDVSGLFLAGDWVETRLPATIEGAVVSGHRAAASARAFLERIL